MNWPMIDIDGCSIDIDDCSSPSPPPPPHPKRSGSDLTLTLNPSSQTSSTNAEAMKPEERGIRLIQLLLNCTGHAASSNLPSADACLRLISSLSSPTGDSIQRLSARLASSLSSRLLRHKLPGLFASLHPQWTPRPPARGAHLAFARALPYLPFAHAVAIRTLLRAIAGEHLVHVIDLKGSHSSLDVWAPFLHCLAHGASRPPPQLKLTCISPDARVLNHLGSSLVKLAQSLSVPFQFNPVSSSLASLNPDSLRVKPGEALAIASFLGLHELLAESSRAEEFLTGLRWLSPRSMVTMEQEGDHNSGKLVERFVEALHYYSAVYDSVEAVGLKEEERCGVEEVVGWEVENVVGREGRERTERHDKAERWAERMGRTGFRQGRIGWEAAEEGRRVVERWCSAGGGGKGYGVVVDSGSLMICWHGRPLYAVSVWQC